ncbi:10902_t:CDS:2, partial [Racocetra persica]
MWTECDNYNEDYSPNKSNIINDTSMVRKFGSSAVVPNSSTGMTIGSTTITREHGLAIARELDSYVEQSGGRNEYTASIEVQDERGRPIKKGNKKNAGERPVIFESELPTTYRSGGFSVPRQGYHLVSPKAQTEPFLPTSNNSSHHLKEDGGLLANLGVFSVGDKEQIEKPKESLVYGVKWNIEGTTYYTERKGQDGIIERNRQKREAEKSQSEVSTNQNKEVGDINLNEINQRTASDKKDQTDEEVQQQNIAQKTDNKDNNKNIYYGIGAISLVLL